MEGIINQNQYPEKNIYAKIVAKMKLRMRYIFTHYSNYEIERKELYKAIYLNYSNFVLLNDTNKALWLLSHEREDILTEIAIYIVKYQEKRNRNHTLNSNNK